MSTSASATGAAQPLRSLTFTAWRGRAVAALCACLAAAALHAQPRETPQLVDGSLLVAGEMLEDPNFAESVVLVLRHDEGGTAGLILNRPTLLAPDDVFAELAERLGEYSGALYRGGSIEPSRMLFIVRGLAAVVVQGIEVVDNVYLSLDPEAFAQAVRVAKTENDLRVFAGHAEWGPGQVLAEIEDGTWRVLPGSADLIFSAEPSALWREAMRRTENQLVATLGLSDQALSVDEARGAGEARRADQALSADASGGSLVRSALR